MSAQTELDAEIEKAFVGKGRRLVVIAKEQAQRAEEQAAASLAAGDIPHCGQLAEWTSYVFYVRLVEFKTREGKTWVQALDAVREMAYMRLHNTDTEADPWLQAELWSMRKGATRFIRDTDHLRPVRS